MMTTYPLQQTSPDSSMTADVRSVKAKREENVVLQAERETVSQGKTEQGPLNETVKSIVDDLIQDVVFTASLREEKEKVQRLVNNLVSKVRDEATASAAADVASVTIKSVPTNSAPKSAAALPASSVSGVPFGDHRLRHVGSLPVTWMQTMDSITLNITVPGWVRKQNVSIAFTPGSVKVRVVRDPQSPPIIAIQEPLVAKIDTDGCTWALEDARKERQLTLELEKGREQWWARLFMTDDPKLYSIVEASGRGSSPSHSEVKPVPTVASDVSSKKIVANGIPRGLSPSESTSHAHQKRGKSSLTTVSRGKESVQGLDEAVAAVVNEVVESVADPAAKSKAVAVAGGSRASRVSQRATGRRQPQQKIITKKDLLALVEQYKEEFKKGGPGGAEAALQLAIFYQHGIGLKKDDAQAARLYKFGLENGVLDPSAAFQLGLINNQGAAGMDPNPTEAVRWWRVSASLGNAVAMFNLGVMAMNGNGCYLDPVAAYRWWRQAITLNPQLKPPHFSPAQIEERMATAAKQKKERLKAALPPEERKRRRDEALQKARAIAYTSAGILGVGLSVVAIRYWWRNRL